MQPAGAPDATGRRAVRGKRPAGPLAEPHHDGSELCVLEKPDAMGRTAVLRLRAPRGSAGKVYLRYVQEGEPRTVAAVVDEQDGDETWWRAALPVTNPVVRYRWLLAGGDAGYGWVNGRGVFPYEVPGSDDFVLSVAAGGPDWHLGAVVYEIFPDRFAASGLGVEPPAWAVPRPWDALPEGRSPRTARELFGGDLLGIEAHLDHVERLGANVLYLTPFFPAGSTHRYDASSFDRVDPLLGGDAALSSLIAAARSRDIRLVGDLTLNHCGATHDWFFRADRDPASPERDFFYFDRAHPHGYATWLGVRSLPTLDWRSEELRDRMGGVARRWLEVGLDGWRIDVANMVGRLGDIDLNHEVARWAHEIVDGALLLAEHGHDFRPDLDGRGWNGVMNYAGFLRPVWWWLAGGGMSTDLFSPAPAPAYDGSDAVSVMRAFRAGVPWEAVLHSWALLDSHDTARFRTVTASRDRHLVGIGLQMTSPGVPMVFAGDEIGLEGEWGEDARRTMPWDCPETWDRVLLEETRRLIALRRSSDALVRGGIRYAHVGPDAVAYLRETRAERLLCLASRDVHAPVRLPLAALGTRGLETLYGGDAVLEGGDAVLPGDGPAFSIWKLEEAAPGGPVR